MCFLLYLGTDHPVPLISWDENARALHTHELSEHEQAVAAHFNTQHVAYVGSSLNCGCGFRYAEYGDGDLSPFDIYGSIPDEDRDPEEEREKQTNQQQLHDLLIALSPKGSIELYGCWDGDFELPPREQDTIKLSRLLDEHFYFHQRCHYKVV
jgi:hypothetical protein